MNISKSKITKRASILLFLLILALVVYAQPPIFDPDPNGENFTIYQGELFTYDVNATGGSINFTDDTEMFVIGLHSGLINFTPKNSDVRNYTGSDAIVIIAKNSEGADIALLNFFIFNVNDPPNITGWRPLNLNTTVKEGQYLYLNVTAIDVDMLTPYGDFLNYSWLIDNRTDKAILNFTNRTAVYHPGFFDAGLHNITAIVWDRSNATANLTWRVNVTNKNREPWLNNSFPPLINLIEDNWTIGYNNLTMENYFVDNDTDDYPLNYSFQVVKGSINNINISFIRTNVTLFGINLTGFNVSFHPINNFFGNMTIRFVAYDGYNTSIGNNITLNVSPINDPPEITPIPLQFAYLGVPWSYQVDATDVDDPASNLHYYINDSMINMNVNNGIMSFTPMSEGNYSFNISVDDSKVNSSTIFYLTVVNNTIPKLYPLPLLNRTATERQLLSFTVYGNDTDQDDKTNLFFWTSFSYFSIDQNGSRATFSLTPTEQTIRQITGDGGGNITTVTIYVNDTKGSMNSSFFRLEIIDIDFPPFLLLQEAISKTRVNKTYTQQVTVNDNDAPPETLTFGTNTSWVKIQQTDANHALINLTPNESQKGVWNISVNVTDETGLFDTTSFLLNVTDNSPPYFTYVPSIKLCYEDSLCQIDIDASDPDNDDLYFDSNLTTTPPLFVEINHLSGLINLTPNQSQEGKFNISVNVTDVGGMSDSSSFILNISLVNDAPYFDPALDSYSEWLNMTEGIRWVLTINAFDEENITDLEFSIAFNQNYSTNETPFNITRYKNYRDVAIINFTPTRDYAGENQSANITVSDGESNHTEVVYFNIYFVNNPPNITGFSPNSTNISIKEPESVMFIVNVTDAEVEYGFNDSISYRWVLKNNTNSTVVSISLNYTFQSNYLSAGNYSINFTATDQFNASASIRWRLKVNNTNRIPLFGSKILDSYNDFSSAMESKTNIDVKTEGTLILLFDGLNYADSGIFTSKKMDFKLRQSSAAQGNTTGRFTLISWRGNFTDQTNVTMQTRTSNDGTESPWSSVLYNPNGSTIQNPNARYLRFRTNLSTQNTSKTPVLDEIEINYLISNITINEDTTMNDWLDLDDFFTELDTDDQTKYFFTGGEHLGPSITAIDHIAGLKPEADWNGIESLRFGINDSYNVTYSNTIYVRVLDVPETERTTPTPVTQTRTVTRTVTQTIEEPEPFSLELIKVEEKPKRLNDSIIIPVKLMNQGDVALREVLLLASSEYSGMLFVFSNNYFDTIYPGEEFDTELTITNFEQYDSFDVLITAEVTRPPFTDTAKIFLDTRNITTIEQQIIYAKDLLTRQPACLELNELLVEAEEALRQGQNEKTQKLVKSVIDGCQYILSADNKIEKPLISEKAINTANTSIALLAIVLTLIIVVILVIGWFVKKRV